MILTQVEKSGETPEKEQIEMTEEKKDDSNEKDKKKKKEKKPKEKKEPKEKGPNCIDVISKDLDLGNRDCNGVNTEIDVSEMLVKFLQGNSDLLMWHIISCLHTPGLYQKCNFLPLLMVASSSLFFWDGNNSPTLKRSRPGPWIA